jgi:hypothetical protein
VDAVVDGFQLGGLVHHILGVVTLPQSCSQAAMCTASQSSSSRLKVPVRPAIGVAGGAGEHLGELRDPGAVATGVGALGVDGAGDELDEGLEEVFLRFDQRLAFKGYRCRAGKSFHEAQAGVVAGGVAEQEHGTDQFGLAVKQGNGNGVAGVGQACRAATQCRNILGCR